MSKPELLVDGRNLLGESAMWHPREQKFYWIDARAPALYRLEAGNRVTTIPLPAMAGAVVPRKSGGIAIALQNGFHALDTKTHALSFIADPEPDLPDNRINDGSCDRMGRFWAGTQHMSRSASRAARCTGSIPTTACGKCFRASPSPTWCGSARTTGRCITPTPTAT